MDITPPKTNHFVAGSTVLQNNTAINNTKLSCLITQQAILALQTAQANVIPLHTTTDVFLRNNTAQKIGIHNHASCYACNNTQLIAITDDN